MNLTTGSKTVHLEKEMPDGVKGYYVGVLHVSHWPLCGGGGFHFGIKTTDKPANCKLCLKIASKTNQTHYNQNLGGSKQKGVDNDSDKQE